MLELVTLLILIDHSSSRGSMPNTPETKKIIIRSVHVSSNTMYCMLLHQNLSLLPQNRVSDDSLQCVAVLKGVRGKKSLKKKRRRRKINECRDFSFAPVDMK